MSVRNNFELKKVRMLLCTISWTYYERKTRNKLINTFVFNT